VTHIGTLAVLVGPTAVGKTDLSIEIAKKIGCPIISADSRQVYREMRIGTAVPEPEQLLAVPHHFIQNRSIFERYTAGMFEVDVLHLLRELFIHHPVVLLVGGSGLYIDAVCKGIDQIPATDEKIRQELLIRLQNNGLQSLTNQLKELDPDFYDQVDRKNPNRVMRALEVCLVSGKPYSQLRNNFSNQRFFKTVMVGVNRDREVLYQRINLRVDQMMIDGLLEEAKSLYPHRSHNALNTVGYRELFQYLDGSCSLEEAIDLIKRNSRRYAKRQLTWFSKYPINWFNPEDSKEIITFLEKEIAEKE
jgi:tRNA dimethylallyltransferase